MASVRCDLLKGSGQSSPTFIQTCGKGKSLVASLRFCSSAMSSTSLLLVDVAAGTGATIALRNGLAVICSFSSDDRVELAIRQHSTPSGPILDFD